MSKSKKYGYNDEERSCAQADQDQSEGVRVYAALVFASLVTRAHGDLRELSAFALEAAEEHDRCMRAAGYGVPVGVIAGADRTAATEPAP